MQSDITQFKQLLNQSNMVDDDIIEIKETISQLETSQKSEIESLQANLLTLEDDFKSKNSESLIFEITKLKQSFDALKLLQEEETKSTRRRVNGMKKKNCQVK